MTTLPPASAVSRAFREANPHLYGTPPGRPLPNPEPQRNEAPALGAAIQGKEESLQRTVVRFTGYRVRPLDPDNFAGSVKDLLDGLRHAGLIPGDDPWRIKLETEQVKVRRYAEERTIIEVITGTNGPIPHSLPTAPILPTVARSSRAKHALSPMSKTNKQKRREMRNRMFAENPHCFFCNALMVNEPSVPHVPDKSNRAVLFHSHSRLDGLRGKFPGKCGSVLCCRKCADQQAAAENATIPLAEQHARSRRYPQPPPWQRQPTT